MASGRIRHGRSTPKDVRVWLSSITRRSTRAATEGSVDLKAHQPKPWAEMKKPAELAPGGLFLKSTRPAIRQAGSRLGV